MSSLLVCKCSFGIHSKSTSPELDVPFDTFWAVLAYDLAELRPFFLNTDMNWYAPNKTSTTIAAKNT
jgi:hypothetical protein